MTRMKIAVALVAAASAGAASALETVTYSYDSLGRLTGSVTSGGPNSGISTGTSFDPAGNRSSYSVTGSSAARVPAADVSSARPSQPVPARSG